MMKPTIHGNGTSRRDLLEQNVKVLSLLRQAIDALAEATPHGRDYYPQGPNALHAALEEHGKRRERLLSVYSELEALAEHIQGE